MFDARLAAGGQIFFEAEDVSVHDFSDARTRRRSRRSAFARAAKAQEVDCDFIAGCDGFHGVCRPSIPAGALTVYDRIYPFGWLGILAEAPPSSDELIYAYHERGFALLSMRSPEISRLYVQCAPDEDIHEWPDDRIWQELHMRLATADGKWKLTEGPIAAEGRHGDAQLRRRADAVRQTISRRRRGAHRSAHRSEGTESGGCGCCVLARALAEFYASGRKDLLENYSKTCLRRVWKVQRFSWWMTSMLHLFNTDNAFDRRRQLAELDYVTSSRAASQTLAENYVGLPME